MYTLLDYFFAVFHAGLVLFNLTGWIWRRTRRLHLAAIGLTILSWFGLGAFFGWGYCPCTDWHWRVKRMLGENNLPGSYIKYYLDRLTGVDWNPFVVDMATLILGLSVLVLTCSLNWRDYKAGRRASAGASPRP